MQLEVDTKRWRVNANKGPARDQTLEKQLEIQKQTEVLSVNKVIARSTAEHYSQAHLTPKPIATKGDEPPDLLETDQGDIEFAPTEEANNLSSKSSSGWRFCIDFRNLNACSPSIGWPLPNIRHMLQRLGRRAT